MKQKQHAVKTTCETKRIGVRTDRIRFMKSRMLAESGILFYFYYILFYLSYYILIILFYTLIYIHFILLYIL